MADSRFESPASLLEGALKALNERPVEGTVHLPWFAPDRIAAGRKTKSITYKLVKHDGIIDHTRWLIRLHCKVDFDLAIPQTAVTYSLDIDLFRWGSGNDLIHSYLKATEATIESWVNSYITPAEHKEMEEEKLVEETRQEMLWTTKVETEKKKAMEPKLPPMTDLESAIFNNLRTQW